MRFLLALAFLVSCGGRPTPCQQAEEVQRAQQDKLERIALALGSCAVVVALDQGTSEADTGSESERITGVASILTCLSAGAASVVSVYYAPIPQVCIDESDAER